MAKILFKVTTPLPDIPEVTLYASTWFNHITVNHPELYNQLDNVKIIVSSPTMVFENPGKVTRFIFVNTTVTGLFGQPLSVIVDQPDQKIITAYYNQGLTSPVGHKIKWKQ